MVSFGSVLTLAIVPLMKIPPSTNYNIPTEALESVNIEVSTVDEIITL